MIDWTTVVLPYPHDREISGGLLMEADQNGEVKWQMQKSLSVHGTHNSTVLVKSQDSIAGPRTHIYVSGNPAKFLYGHNVTGPDDLRILVAKMGERLLNQIGYCPSDVQLQKWRAGDFAVKKVDINYMRNCGSRAAARQMLYIISQTCKMRYSGRGEFTGTTLYFAKKSRRRAIKLYCKGDEIDTGGRSRRLPDSLGELKTELLKMADDAVRIELVLHSPELKQLGLDVGTRWNPSTAHKVFEQYMNKLEFSPNVNLAGAVLVRLPRFLQSTYGQWLAGIDPRTTLKPTTFHRHRRLLRQHGIDIGALPLSSCPIVT